MSPTIPPVRFYRDSEFDYDERHFQRCTTECWRNALLNKQDCFPLDGVPRRLVGVDIGYGVIEVRFASNLSERLLRKTNTV
jgi:hypothetical protein